MSRVERLRWRIANLVDKIPGQCWSDLAEWAGRWTGADDPDHTYGLPWRPQGRTCGLDANRAGSCYCGKIQAEPWAAAVHTAHASAGRWSGDPVNYQVLCACGWHGQDYRTHFESALTAASTID